MSPKVLVIQHFAADAPWYLEHALKTADVEIDLRRTDLGDVVPSLRQGYDALVVLGGPSSAAQRSIGYPSLEAEIRLFVEAHDVEKPALGICLGAQVLARAAGAEVYRGRQGKEIGWSTIRLTERASTTALFDGLDSEVKVLQWHGDTFDLPDDAELLAHGGMYSNQVFQWGSCVGFQPHLEVDSVDAVTAFVEAFPDDAEIAGGAAKILDETLEGLDESSGARSAVFDAWARSIHET